MIIHLHHLVAGIDPVEQKGNFRVVGDAAGGVVDARAVEIRFIETFLQRDGVAHGGEAAVDRAVTERNQDLAVLAEFLQHAHVFLVRAAAFHDADEAFACKFSYNFV